MGWGCYMEMSDCPNLESLELDAINLLSFKYTGPQIEIPFENLPNLTTLCIRKGLFRPLYRKFPKILTIFSQLQKLGLRISVEVERRRPHIEFPRMSQLKEMELTAFTFDHLDSLLFLSWWVNSCPSLHRFALDFSLVRFSAREIEKGRRIVHHSLKVVEITGFVGAAVDTELCIFFIENAIALEKMVLDPIPFHKRGGPFENIKYDRRRALVARQRAKHLRPSNYVVVTISLSLSLSLFAKARRALHDLKGIVKLQALVGGYNVRSAKMAPKRMQISARQVSAITFSSKQYSEVGNCSKLHVCNRVCKGQGKVPNHTETMAGEGSCCLMANIWGIKQGLIIAKSLEARNLIVEVDMKGAIDAQNGDNSDDLQQEILFRDCNALREEG
ncbi:hypothetical protein F3Y22_tig00014304pilonHSYRG00023 [Hibiscus syriacus]|uniref:At1g61320/AtMIF1 LRR domain-containing protein n=1 Tax=Hibiscus syriacus TaxID=106335 RepID=A0A6A3C3L1_HIBSY|nr:hypothetical protein F3Y22_tig00014304pilonHSYRG00023 [Hibiscus syriacus]